MLSPDKVINSKGSVGVNGVNLRLNVPKDLVLGVRTMCKLENLLKCRNFGPGVCQLHS